MSYNAGDVQASLVLNRTPFTQGLEQARREASEFEKRSSISVNVDADTRAYDTKVEAARRKANDLSRVSGTVKFDADTRAYDTKVAAARVKADQLARSTGTVRFDADTSAFTAKVDEARQRAGTLARESGTVRFDADTSAFTTKVVAAKAIKDELAAAKVAKIDADIASLQAKIAQAKGQLDETVRTRTAKFDADASALEAKIEQERARLDSLAAKRVDPKLDADASALEAKISQESARLDALMLKRVSPRLDADAAALEAKIAQETARLDALQAKTSTPKVDADIAACEAKIAQAQARLEEVNAKRVDPAVDADISALMAKVQQAQAQLDAINAKRVDASVDADISAGEAKIAGFEAQLDVINGKRATATTDVDDAAAEAKIAALEAQIQVLDGRRAQITVTADTSQAEGALSGLSARAAGIGALVPAIGGIGGALLGLVPAAAAGAGGLGAFALASQDVGKAVSAQNDTTAKAGQSAQDMANKAAQAAARQASSASAIASAQDRVKSAIANVGNVQANVADAQIRAAEQVQNAETNAGRVRQQVANQAISSSEQVRSAVQRVTTAQEQAARSEQSALRQVQQAEQALANAQQSAQRAQENLTNARKAATRQLEDMNLQVQDGALAQRAAVLGVQQAQEELNKTLADPSASGLQRAQAQLSYDQAVQQVTDVNQRNKQLAEDKADADRRGVEGSKQVQSALDGVKSSTQQVGNAQQSLSDALDANQQAQLDGARTVADAQQALATAQRAAAQQQIDGQYQIAQADRQVTDARRAQEQQARQGAQQVASAQQQVVSAQRALADAQRQAATAALQSSSQQAAATDKVKEALDKLPPAARAFAVQLRGLKPVMDDLQNTAAAGLFPGVERGIDAVLPRLDQYRGAIGLVASATGTAVEQIGQGMASDYWVGFTNQISTASTTLLPGFVDSLGNVTRGAGDMVTALIPAAPAANGVLDAFGRLESSLAPFLGQTVTPLANGFSYLIDAGLTPLGPLLGALGPLLEDMQHILADGVGGALQLVTPLLRALDDVLSPIASVMDMLPGPINGVAFALLGLSMTSKGVGGTLSAAWNLISPASTAQRLDNVAGKVKNLGGALSGVSGPAAAAAADTDKATAAASRAGREAETAAGKAKGLGTALGNVSGPASAAAGSSERASSSIGKAGDAAETAAKKGGGFTGALRGMGSALPLIGVALVGAAAVFDSFVTSTDDATAALERGGNAAAQMNTTLLQQTGWKQAIGNVPLLGGAISYFIPTVGDATQAVKDHYNSLDTLGKRTLDATKAQGDYSSAVEHFGATSPQAVSALNNLRDATQREADAQTAQRLQTDLATASIYNQQNRILAGINAQAAQSQAQDAMAQAQKTYNDAVSKSGPASDDAKSALASYNGSIATYLTNVQQAALTQAQANGSQNAARDAVYATNRATIDLANNVKGPLPDALNQMIGHMSQVDLVTAGATIKVDNLGHSVAVLPNGKTVQLDVNNATATVKLQQTIDLVNAARGHLTIDANGQPANDESRRLLGDINASIGTLHIDGDPGPGDGSLRALLDRVNAARQAMHIEGDPMPATNDTNVLLDWVARQESAVKTRADTRPGERDVNAFKDTIPAPPPPIPVSVDTRPASGGLKGWLTGLGNIPIFGGAFSFAAGLLARGGLAGTNMHRFAVPGFAAGSPGAVIGPGSGTSDSIPAMLSNGEYVVRASAVQRVGVSTLDAINRMSTGGLAHFAAGGPASAAGPLAAAGAAQAGSAGTLTGASVAAGGASGAAAAGTASGTATGALPYTPAQAGAVQAATQGLTASMTAQAAVVTGILNPALAANTTATAAHSAASTAMAGTNTGTLVPSFLAVTSAITGQMLPTWATLRADQAVTQGSTTATAGNMTANSAQMAASITGMSLTGQVQHAALRGTQAVTRADTDLTNQNMALHSQNMAIDMTSMSIIGQQQHANLRTTQLLTRIDTDQTNANFAANNANIAASTTGMSVQVQGQHTQVRAAQGATGAATAAFADGWQAQMARVVPDSANPVRWVMQFPMAGIVNAWNNLDGQFALNKHVNPVLPNFARGGRFATGGVHHEGDGKVVGPGTGTSDEVNARLSDGEFVIRESIARPHQGFLSALNAGQPEALEAAGRRGLPMFAAGGAVAAQQVAQQAAGKPYVWGAAGPNGFDCSGLVSAMVNASDGRYPYSRRGTTGTMPWAGFVNGLNGPLTAGWNGHHMAATVNGTNAEARQTGTPVYFGGPAVGSDSAQFTGHATYAPAGFGGYRSGGPGSGGGGVAAMFDPTPAVNAAFAQTYQQIGDFPKFFGNSPQASRDIGIAKVGADSVKQKAMDQLTAMFSGGASMGPVSASHVADIVNAAKSKGIDHAGAVIAIMTGLQESGVRILANPAVPASMALPHDGVGYDHDSVGIFQQRQSWGPTPLLMNPFGSAQLFFNKLGRGPYGDYGSAAQRVQVSKFPGAYSKWQGAAEGLVRGAGFDSGGIVPPGNSLVRNWTGGDEHAGILTDDQWQSLRGLSNSAQRGETSSGSLDGLTAEQIAAAVESGMRNALADAELSGHVTTDTGHIDARIKTATGAITRAITGGTTT